jgi:hypothetical protein
MEDIISKL